MTCGDAPSHPSVSEFPVLPARRGKTCVVEHCMTGIDLFIKARRSFCVCTCNFSLRSGELRIIFMLSVLAAIIAGGKAVVKINPGAKERIASMMTFFPAMKPPIVPMAFAMVP